MMSYSMHSHVKRGNEENPTYTAGALLGEGMMFIVAGFFTVAATVAPSIVSTPSNYSVYNALNAELHGGLISLIGVVLGGPILTALKGKVTTSFVVWYFFGRGQTISLHTTPYFNELGPRFKELRSVKEAVDVFKSEVISSYQGDGCQGTITYGVNNAWYKGETDLTDDDDFFVFGNGHLYRTASCSNGSCQFHFALREEFIDAVDIYDTMNPHDQDIPGGIPYDIEYDFEESGSCQ